MNTDLIKLLNDEQIEYTVKYTRKTLLLDLFLIYITIALTNMYQDSTLSLIMMIVFIPLVIKFFMDIRRIFFDRVHITNKRIIMIKGLLFKRIMIIRLSKIEYVSHKRRFLDKYFKTGKVKITTFDHMTFKFKGLKHWDHVVNLTYTHARDHKQN